MELYLVEAAPAEFEALVPVLSEADEDDERIRAEMSAASRTRYRALVRQELVGAATMRWQEDESELVYIVVTPQWRGQGYGKSMVRTLLAKAGQRGTASVIVGTANSALDNIAFYQRCGFRMDQIRRDYFAYVDPPVTRPGR